MTQATAAAARSASGPAAAGATRFLVELATACTALRLYGAEHPAYQRAVASAAGALDGTVARMSITPRGFSPSPPEAPAELVQLAKRLRAMGLVGLTISPGLTAENVHALVVLIEQVDRSSAAAAKAAKANAMVEKIAAASGGRVRAVPLRLDGLRLVEGAASAGGDGTSQDDDDPWRQMFASALVPHANIAASAELARTLENALRSSGLAGNADSAAPVAGEPLGEWDAMARAWVKQLARIDAAQLRGAGNISAPQTAGTGAGAEAAGKSLDAVATFLTTLSPELCQRLMQEVIATPAVPEPVVQALAQRLSPGVVLGALAAVDEASGTPSSAALALLRKMSANIPSASAAGTLGAVAEAGSRSQMDDIAATLECLLRTNREQQFVPEEYLQRRQELSAHALETATARAGKADKSSADSSRGGETESGNQTGAADAADAAVVATPLYPDDAETARHAANLALDILADAAANAANAPPAELTGTLAFVSDRVAGWVRAGQFTLAVEAMSLAARFLDHIDPMVAGAAHALLSAALIADDLLEGVARRNGDRAAAVTELADLLRHGDGRALAALLSLVKPGAGVAADMIVEAFRTVLPGLAEPARQRLFGALEGAPPPMLMAVVTGMTPPDALRAVEAIVPHATSPVRAALVNTIFRRDLRWPMPLIEHLLRDEEPEIRRRAVMKLVSDTDLATAGDILGAASRAGTYEVDVALWLAELLRRHRHHPDVRQGWRQWMWSRRWWVSLLFLNAKKTRRAA